MGGIKKAIWLLGLGFLALALLWAGRNTSTPRDASLAAEEYVPNEVLVKFKPEAGKYLIQAGIGAVQGKVITHLKKEISALEWDPDSTDFVSFPGDPYLIHVKVPESIGTEAAISLFKLNPNVEYAETNGIYRLCVDPNDSYFSWLWGLKNTAQWGGTYDADIDAPEAWDIFTGSPNVIVADTDTEIDYTHVDLSSNMWAGLGWDFYAGDSDPQDEYDPKYHGTHVAGTIGAVGNNNQGVTGVCWTVRLMALRIGSGPGISIDAAVNAIDYARSNNAKIINASWGGPNYYNSLYDAIYRARTSGILFCAAAGNDSNNNDQHPRYPASYNLDNIIAVLATDYNDHMPLAIQTMAPLQ